MKPREFTTIINRKRYSTQTATLVAHDAYFNGHNWERDGRNSFLYKTEKGAFFLVTQTTFTYELDTLEPIPQGTAILLYEGRLSVHEISYEEAFPDVNIEEA
jgi:hypothetical protein